METLEWAKEKLHDIKLPEGMEITDLLNMAHGQLEAMGIPADPEKIKEMIGLDGLNMEDLSKLWNFIMDFRSFYSFFTYVVKFIVT